MYWPEAKAGYESVSQPCPGNGARMVTRECDQNGSWTIPDYRTCRTFDELQTQIVGSHAPLSHVSSLIFKGFCSHYLSPHPLPTSASFHQKNLSADSVVDMLDLLSVVVEGTPLEEQNSNATAVIASTFSAAAVILQEQNTQLTLENKTEVRVQTVYCFFIVYPA